MEQKEIPPIHLLTKITFTGGFSIFAVGWAFYAFEYSGIGPEVMLFGLGMMAVANVILLLRIPRVRSAVNQEIEGVTLKGEFEEPKLMFGDFPEDATTHVIIIRVLIVGVTGIFIYLTYIQIPQL